jgi:hypothetical protein
MSDRYGEAWAMAVARTRGLDIGPEAASGLAESVAPILAAFAGICEELSADDDMYEFRRLLAAEAARG